MGVVVTTDFMKPKPEAELILSFLVPLTSRAPPTRGDPRQNAAQLQRDPYHHTELHRKQPLPPHICTIHLRQQLLQPLSMVAGSA